MTQHPAFQDTPIKRALLSVTNKDGIVAFASALSQEFGVEIVSTGGTARALREGGVTVRSIDELTGFPEMLDGRVKTLHPRVHGGLLARRDLVEHLEQAAAHDIGLIDLVAVNLYAFEETVAKEGVLYAEAIENIDIGGPSMLRSAAKNHASVTVATHPSHYALILQEMRSRGGATTLATRRQLACEVFELTSAYDNAIYNWMQGELEALEAQGELGAQEAPHLQGKQKVPHFRSDKRLFLTKVANLRYGENPHQQAAFYRFQDNANPCALANATQLQGKELSYNNYLDLDAAWAAVREFEDPTAVIVKHLTPCGIASNNELAVAYQQAFDCDPVSAFGGVMAFNRTVCANLVQAIINNGQFIEALVAPAFDAAALELLATKPSARVLACGSVGKPGGSFDWRSVEGGMLCMTADSVAERPEAFEVVSNRMPSQEELAQLLFAWKACKSVKSNAILIASNHATVGIGAGQPNRVNSAELAVKQAGEKARGAVAASDAFMPFADSLEVLAAAGVSAVIQPGGSIRDAEVLEAANKANMVLVFTGHRHFRH